MHSVKYEWLKAGLSAERGMFCLVISEIHTDWGSKQQAWQCLCPQEIGYTHMKIAEGVNSLLQMAGLLARLCQKTAAPAAS